jgi:hypothetical protein
MRAVEVSEIWAVEGLSGANSRWKKRDVLGMILELWTGGGVPFAEKVGAITYGLGYNVRSTKAVRKLGHSIDGGFALDLDSHHDEIVY